MMTTQTLTPASGAQNERGTIGETLFRSACFSAATFLLVALGCIMVALLIGGWPAFAKFGFGFFTSSEWNPVTDVYGAAGPILGTLYTAMISLVIALPLAIGVSVFLVEFCPPRLAQPIATVVDLLAGIPSIVYGMWGITVFAPWFAHQFGLSSGQTILTASIILAVMILPYMTSVFRELLLTVPSAVREAAYGLGCTPFETVKSVMIPYIKQGIVGGTMLGLGRALGETMAVTYIIGNVPHDIPNSLLLPGATIASTIASEFGEAQDMHLAALIAMGLVLFLMTFAVLGVARFLLNRQR